MGQAFEVPASSQRGSLWQWDGAALLPVAPGGVAQILQVGADGLWAPATHVNNQSTITIQAGGSYAITQADVTGHDLFLLESAGGATITLPVVSPTFNARVVICKNAADGTPATIAAQPGGSIVLANGVVVGGSMLITRDFECISLQSVGTNWVVTSWDGPIKYFGTAAIGAPASFGGPREVYYGSIGGVPVNTDFSRGINGSELWDNIPVGSKYHWYGSGVQKMELETTYGILKTTGYAAGVSGQQSYFIPASDFVSGFGAPVYGMVGAWANALGGWTFPEAAGVVGVVSPLIQVPFDWQTGNITITLYYEPIGAVPGNFRNGVSMRCVRAGTDSALAALTTYDVTAYSTGGGNIMYGGVVPSTLAITGSADMLRFTVDRSSADALDTSVADQAFYGLKLTYNPRN